MTPHNPETQCAEIAGLIDPYVDGDLSDDAARRVAAHVETCEECRAQHEFAQSLKRDLNAMPGVPCPDHVLDAVLAKIAPQPRTRSWRGPLIGAASLAAAASFIDAVSLFAINPPAKEPIQTTETIESPAPSLSPEELARAEAQVKWTLDYLARVNERNADFIRKPVSGVAIISPASDVLTEVFGAAEEAPKSPEEG